jgi:hypothetical protein
MPKPMRWQNRLARALAEVLRQSLRTSFDLFKVIVPIILLIRLLDLLGVIKYLGIALGPVMELVGLPGQTGLVWATTMVTNLYGGVAVFVSLDVTMSAAQVTVLTTMMLIAHNLPVELRIAQKAGTRFRMMAVLRIGGALLAGLSLNHFYRATGWLSQTNKAVFRGALDNSWLGWLQGQGIFLLGIMAIILALMLLIRTLKAVGLMDLLARLMEPGLRLLGMSRDAAPVTVIGMTLGLAYGGGLIIQEARSGILGKRDVFFSLALMGLTHSLFEDTSLMMMLGGRLSGILVWRVAFSLLVIFLLVRVLGRVSERTFDRYFCRPVTPGQAAAILSDSTRKT